jgi:hypothetical protein
LPNAAESLSAKTRVFREIISLFYNQIEAGAASFSEILEIEERYTSFLRRGT